MCLHEANRLRDARWWGGFGRFAKRLVSEATPCAPALLSFSTEMTHEWSSFAHPPLGLKWEWEAGRASVEGGPSGGERANQVSEVRAGDTVPFLGFSTSVLDQTLQREALWRQKTIPCRTRQVLSTPACQVGPGSWLRASEKPQGWEESWTDRRAALARRPKQLRAQQISG